MNRIDSLRVFSAALREIFLNDEAGKARVSHAKPQSRQEEKTQTEDGARLNDAPPWIHGTGLSRTAEFFQARATVFEQKVTKGGSRASGCA
jgi:hypothetical protein